MAEKNILMQTPKELSPDRMFKTYPVWSWIIDELNGKLKEIRKIGTDLSDTDVAYISKNANKRKFELAAKEGKEFPEYATLLLDLFDKYCSKDWIKTMKSVVSKFSKSQQERKFIDQIDFEKLYQLDPTAEIDKETQNEIYNLEKL